MGRRMNTNWTAFLISNKDPDKSEFTIELPSVFAYVKAAGKSAKHWLCFLSLLQCWYEFLVKVLQGDQQRIHTAENRQTRWQSTLRFLRCSLRYRRCLHTSPIESSANSCTVRCATMTSWRRNRVCTFTAMATTGLLVFRRFASEKRKRNTMRPSTHCKCPTLSKPARCSFYTDWHENWQYTMVEHTTKKEETMLGAQFDE